MFFFLLFETVNFIKGRGLQRRKGQEKTNDKQTKTSLVFLEKLYGLTSISIFINENIFLTYHIIIDLTYVILLLF